MRTMVLVAFAALATTRAAAITLGQVDNFQDGTFQGWGGGSSPFNVATGGPNGSGDRYLRISAVSGNLGAKNEIQWTGDYVAAGVVRIGVQLNNLGANPLALRISVFGSTGTFTTTDETVLPAMSGWTPVVFELSDAALTRTSGTGTLAQTLAGVSTLLIRHDPDPISPSGQSNPVTGTLGIDDVTALASPVPEVPLLPAWGVPAAFVIALLIARHALASSSSGAHARS